MKLTVLDWLGYEFVDLYCEARGGSTAAEQSTDLFNQARDALKVLGLGLNDAIRSRVFGIDRPARDAASLARAEILGGKAASSSYIAPKLFSSAASVALDLIACRSKAGDQKVIRPYVPPKQPICSVALGRLLILSGNTSQLAGLKEQVTGDILPRVAVYLAEGGSGWSKVVNVSCYLHESQSPDELRAHFATVAGAMPARLEISFVEGFSAPGKLVEIEVMALRDDP